MLPVSVVNHTFELYGYLPTPLVYTMHLTYFVSATASILSLLALVMDRYFIVVSAIKYQLATLCTYIMSHMVLVCLPAIDLYANRFHRLSNGLQSHCRIHSPYRIYNHVCSTEEIFKTSTIENVDYSENVNRCRRGIRK